MHKMLWLLCLLRYFGSHPVLLLVNILSVSLEHVNVFAFADLHILVFLAFNEMSELLA